MQGGLDYHKPKCSVANARLKLGIESRRTRCMALLFGVESRTRFGWIGE